ncbi:hypothetical protein LQE92_03020 [Lacrimispora sp. NSJ-141]|uniref:Uncharacterized protein n=1 Tax=Lientehia hominis TaxID=2897778 RepID=A0AAP2RHW9_9FIRM|nr:hypothetical protein [Lientehia hominis]MCD2491598.1 hypothetical protein [Lientehia hominis]
MIQKPKKSPLMKWKPRSSNIPVRCKSSQYEYKRTKNREEGTGQPSLIAVEEHHCALIESKLFKVCNSILSTQSNHIKEQTLVQKQPSDLEGCFCIYAWKDHNIRLSRLFLFSASLAIQLASLPFRPNISLDMIQMITGSEAEYFVYLFSPNEGVQRLNDSFYHEKRFEYWGLMDEINPWILKEFLQQFVTKIYFDRGAVSSVTSKNDFTLHFITCNPSKNFTVFF